MPLVLEAQIFDWNVAFSQGRHNLLSLSNRNTRVIRAMHDKERRDDILHVIDRRNLFQEVAVAFKAAIFGLAQLAPQGPVCSRKVTKLAMPTISTAAAHR